MHFDITGYQMVAGLGVMLLALIALILILRKYYHSNTISMSAGAGSQRTKYAARDVFRNSPVFFRIGLVCSLLVTLLAFNYTSYEKPEPFSFVYEPIGIIENSPPIVRSEKPLPPPPPPSKVIEVVVAVENTDDQVEFIDTAIDQPIPEPAVAVTRPADKTLLPPSPPPLPPPPEVHRGPMIMSEIMPRMCTGCENEDLSRTEKNQCASKEMLKYVLSKLKYPTLAREIGIQGVCPVKFVINRDGTISNIELLREIGGGCGKEALRVTSLLKEKCWLPGRQNGEKVAVQMVLPIRFKLE